MIVKVAIKKEDILIKNKIETSLSKFLFESIVNIKSE